MPNIILYTDFTGKIKLPNTDPAHDAEGEDLLTFITDNEATFLTEILGYKMAQDFLTAIALAPTSGIWFDLWKGAEFTDKHGRINKWLGFRNTMQKLSIANYVYVKWIEARQEYMTSAGTKKAKTENAEEASQIRNLCKAWNEMVDLNWIMDDFITQNATDYPDYIGVSSCRNVGYFSQYQQQYGNRFLYTKRNVIGL